MPCHAVIKAESHCCHSWNLLTFFKVAFCAAFGFSGSANSLSQPNPLKQCELIGKAQSFYSAWNRKDIYEAISYFSDDIVFIDAQYEKPFRGKADVKVYLDECAQSLPGWEFIIDDYAEDLARKKLGLKWHVSNASGIPLPFPSQGLSFLTFDEYNLIKECTDMVEPTVKLGPIQLPLLRIVSKVLRIK